MPSRSRSAAGVRRELFAQLVADHRRVRKASRDFRQIGADDAAAREALVRQVIGDLERHAAIEEELLYPAARASLADSAVVDEAEVEHESMHAAIAQLKSMQPDDAKYAARFIVLCEYVLHHAKEEETRLFPAFERARIDWNGLAARMQERREEYESVGAGAAALFDGDPVSLSPNPSDDAPPSARPHARARSLPSAAEAQTRGHEVPATGVAPSGAAGTRRI